MILGFNCGNYGGVQNNNDPCQLIMTVGSLAVIIHCTYQYVLIHRFAEECNQVFDCVMGAMSQAPLTHEMAADPNRDRLLQFKLETRGDPVRGGVPAYHGHPGMHW